ncbi:XdhC family protein [Marinobacteraceae bacterium S3BR75-40.1]
MSETADSMPSSPQQAVLEQTAQWLRCGERVWLCTILSTWGSSPRPPGALLALSESGEWAGSVSGGCLEEDLIRRAQSDALAEGIQLVDYGVEEADKARYRLPCGGHIRLLVEFLAGEDDLAHVEALLQGLGERRRLTRKITLATGERSLLPDPVASGVAVDDEAAYHTLGPQCRLLLVGAGEVARYVARFAMAADFEVTLCEPREAFRRGWGEPGVPVEVRLPDDLIRERFNDRHSAILALAHDPRVDDMALLEALHSQAFYVGAMGSARTSAQRRQRLHELGIQSYQLARLHAPIGLDIGSKTPAEIAISILAQLVGERYRLLQRSLTGR